MIKFLNVLLTVSAMLFAATTYAEETAGEKAKVAAKSGKRAVKKGAHRVGEAVCETVDSKGSCVAKKSANRVEEGKDATVDKVDEIKDKID